MITKQQREFLCITVTIFTLDCDTKSFNLDLSGLMTIYWVPYHEGICKSQEDLAPDGK